MGFNFAPRHAGRSKASLREGLVFMRHLARLVSMSLRKRADRPEWPAAVELDAVDLRGKQLLEPVEKR
jgi:hypothetical protein